MYIKNNDFYFNKNDYLHFNKLKFTVHGYDTRRIINKNYYDYVINVISLHADYGIHIDFHKMYKSNEKIKLLITNNKYRNKMLLLYNLKWLVSTIYNALLLLCKQHVNIFGSDNMTSIWIMPTNKIYSNVNLIKLHKGYMSLHIDTNNQIKQNNTAIAITYSNVNDLPDNKIIIKNNIVRTKHMTTIHPESYNIYYEGIISDSVYFDYNENYYIKRFCRKYYISHHTPPPLLVKFIDNIELFDNIDEAHINSEYDILKYM